MQSFDARELRELVLASGSPRRRELLASLGIRLAVIPSDIDEGDRPGYGPLELARLHASAKTDAVAARERFRPILGADTVVDVDGIVFGKPRDAADAARMLSILSGREHLVHTAFVIADPSSGRRIARDATTRVRFNPLDPAEIARYVATGDPLDKAGAYGIQGLGATLVERIDGDFYTVMGLPLGAVIRSLRELGYAIPAEARA